MLSRVFFFFKQKTAYEMRISDWSSDVCSSDLRPLVGPVRPVITQAKMTIRRSLAFSFLEKYASTALNLGSTLVLARLLTPEEIEIGRASCREECVSTCRSRWSPYH